MAKVTITLEDTEKGTVVVGGEFDPPLDTQGNPEEWTPAMIGGAQMLSLAAQHTVDDSE